MSKKIVVRKQGKIQQPGAQKQEPQAQKQEKQLKGKGSSFVQVFAGKKVVLQSRTGIIYEGIFKEYRDGAFWLRDAVIKGSNFEAKVEDLAIDRAVFAHLHTIPTEIKERTEEA